MVKDSWRMKLLARLEKNNEIALLGQLAGGVEATRKANKKLHEVWALPER